MTNPAISPYSPLRPQPSVQSNSSNNGGGIVRRSSSTGALVANGTMFWLFFRFWKRVTSRNKDGFVDGAASNDSGSSNGGSIHELFNKMADMVSLNLTTHPHHKNMNNEDSSSELSTRQPYWRRDFSAVINWLVTIVGGDKSKLGRIIVVTVLFTREVLMRSIGATSIVLTGAPPLSDWRVDGTTIGIKDSFAVLHRSARDGKGLAIEKGEMNFDTMRQDREQIEQVLNYWFGQASPDGAQKSLWMIASSSAHLLRRVDGDISDKFRSLVLNLSSSPSQGNLQRWTENVETFGWQGKVASIIALDQMSRHIHRHDKTIQGKHIQFIPDQQKLDSIAYNIAKKLQTHHHRELSTGMIPLPMRIFGIMPLRHASTLADLGTVQKDVEFASQLHGEMDRMIRRFRKATNRRLAALQEKARLESKRELHGEDLKESAGEENATWTDEKILDCFPFKADMSNAHNHMVVKTMVAFLYKMNILCVSDSRFKISREIANALRSKPLSTTSTIMDSAPTAIVSLSGGVDSMVIASVLGYLRDTEASRRNTYPDNVLRIVAIHINYANRPESGAEAAYVARYCNALGAKFVCRKINEVTRGVTERHDYEKTAREIRFGLYRRCCEEATHGTSEGRVGIMLGHHRGDLRENVLSNAHKGCGPLHLSGMSLVSKNDGVTLFRPLLSLEKSHIYDYSHTFGVPYFKDTTPHWSTRGKLRNRLLPLLEEIYGEGSMGNLSSLAEESDDARGLMQQTVMSPFMGHVKYYPMGITFQTSPWKDRGLFFWKFVLRQVLHSAGLGMFSDKSVESFLDRIQAVNPKEGWLQCRKDYAVFLQKDGLLFIFYPSSFPFSNGHMKDRHAENPAFRGYGPENGINVGPWTIISEIIKAPTEHEANLLLQTKALGSMEQLMAGDVQYFIKVPIVGSLPCRLVRTREFTKQTRPTAWKGFDLKVQSALPLLGVDHSLLDDEIGPQEYDKTWVLVQVQLLLNFSTLAANCDGITRVPQDMTKSGIKVIE